MASSVPTRQLPLPRFSLRLLLAAFTAVAIGFPVWYRWPYVEEQLQGHSFSFPGRRTTTSWQRQWGGGKWKHGPETRYREDGTKEDVTHYYHGQRHGRYEYWQPTWQETVGYYEHDQKTGTWTTNHYAVKVVEQWRNNRLDGVCEFEWGGARRETIAFSKGRLTHVNGRAWSSPLFDAHHRREAVGDSQAIDDALYSRLGESAWIDFENAALSTAAMQLQAEFFGTAPSDSGKPQILLDPRLPDMHLPVTHSLHGINKRSAMVLLLARVGLIADYHYGSIWITTPELAGDWPDPTDVDTIAPQAGTRLATAWDKPVTFISMGNSSIYSAELPLAEALRTTFMPPGIEIDLTRVEPTSDAPKRFPVTAHMYNFPFRHALAYLLFQAQCCVKLEGETLVILPPDDS